MPRQPFQSLEKFSGATTPPPESEKFASMLQQGLSRLTPDELSALDDAITPNVQVLLSKAFGIEFGAQLHPFVENDPVDPESVEALKRMMADPSYWREQDPRIIAQVREGFERLYQGR